jgi:hypothetical protein
MREAGKFGWRLIFRLVGFVRLTNPGERRPKVESLRVGSTGIAEYKSIRI